MTDTTFTDESIDRIRNIDHNNLLDYLSSAYEVLRKIFSYLSLDDLDTVSKALHKWKPVVETTKKERTKIESFVLTHKQQICETWSEAELCITFSLEVNKSIEKQLHKHITETGQVIAVESRAGVIGTLKDYSDIIQQKFFFKNPPAGSPFATNLRIPRLPEVGVKVLTWKSGISFQDFRDSYSLPNNQIIKCLLILITIQESNREACEQKDDFVSFLQETQSESFAVGGCLIDSFLDGVQEVDEAKYIIFYGDKVEAVSIVLDQDVVTKKKVDSKVEELKLMCPKTSKGVLFVFRCCSRNTVQKPQKGLCEWERKALINFFPSTPVIGCYGYGEFGKKFPDNDVKSLNKRQRKSDIWEYSFSTSVVYVGFKK